jgi:protein TonB
VLPTVERPPVAPPRRPVRRQPEPEPVFELPQSREIDDEDLEETGKGKNKMFIIAGVAVVALAAGGFGLWKMNSKPAAPQPVATQSSTTAMSIPSQSTQTTTAAAPTQTQTSAPTTPAVTETPETPSGLGKQSSDAMNRQLNAPSRLKSDLQALGASNQQAPTQGFSSAGMDGMGSTPVFAPGSGSKVKYEAPKRMSISAGIAVGLLVQKTAPVYPPIAKSAHVSGTVVIQATISKSGTIESPHVISGPVMLRQSALDAVKTWRFRPYLLDGQPVEVETSVNVVFNLGS